MATYTLPYAKYMCICFIHVYTYRHTYTAICKTCVLIHVYTHTTICKTCVCFIHVYTHTYIYTAICKTASGNQLHDSGNSNWGSVTTSGVRWGRRWEGSPKGRGRMYSLVPKSGPTLPSHRLQPARVLCPWDSPGKNTGVGCHFLLQGTYVYLRLIHSDIQQKPTQYCKAVTLQ